MHLLTTAQVLLINTGKHFMAELGGNSLDLLDQRLRLGLQGNLLGTAIFRYGYSGHQALAFQAVEQPRQRRPFHSDTLRQFTLSGHFCEARQVQQHQPTRLGQAEADQTSVEFGTPGT